MIGKGLSFFSQTLLIVGAVLILSACDNDKVDKVKQKGDHFLKEQAELIDKAKEIEQDMADRVKQQMKEADEQSQ